VASADRAESFHVEVDGIDATGPMAVPNTGGWQTCADDQPPGIRSRPDRTCCASGPTRKARPVYLGNINYLKWTAPGLNSAPAVQLTSPGSGAHLTAPPLSG
jgi:hypothetical protein